METTKRDIAEWVEYIGSQQIPVLRQTVRSLDEARMHAESVNGREVANIVMRDPLMVVRVLAYVRPFQTKRQLKEIATIDQAIMMIGVEPFFQHFKTPVIVEDILKPHPQALIGLLFIIRRAQRAARFAYDWAVWRRSPNVEEIYTSALLYDLAEILMWVFAPQESARIVAMQKADSTLRSVVAQQNIFGFRFSDLQQMLCKTWQLPELLLSQFNPELKDKPNFLNVSLAVDLARHSARGWDNTALPDDYAAIEQLLHINRETLLFRLNQTEPRQE
ncbi:MAG: HDOD domain-containing protein [Burkholderiaceae bacterium]|nr:HDOD domain-containing protein [Burkholderiaceae bacterium]